MTKNRTGFTLIELVVVVLIMGILASMGLPYYYKTIETSRANDSIALGHLLGNSYRMFRLDNSASTLTGVVNNLCNSGACSTTDTSACRLVRCNYVAQQDWNSSSYRFSVGGSCGAGIAACVRRVGGSGIYAGWGYDFSTAGGCTNIGGAPSCPKF